MFKIRTDILVPTKKKRMKNLSKFQCLMLIIIQHLYHHSLAWVYSEYRYKIPQQRNFIRKLEEDGGPNMLFITERQQQYILYFSLESLNIIKNINNDKSKNTGFIE